MINFLNMYLSIFGLAIIPSSQSPGSVNDLKHQLERSRTKSITLQASISNANIMLDTYRSENCRLSNENKALKNAMTNIQLELNWNAKLLTPNEEEDNDQA